MAPSTMPKAPTQSMSGPPKGRGGVKTRGVSGAGVSGARGLKGPTNLSRPGPAGLKGPTDPSRPAQGQQDSRDPPTRAAPPRASRPHGLTEPSCPSLWTPRALMAPSTMPTAPTQSMSGPPKGRGVVKTRGVSGAEVSVARGCLWRGGVCGAGSQRAHRPEPPRLMDSQSADGTEHDANSTHGVHERPTHGPRGRQHPGCLWRRRVSGAGVLGARGCQRGGGVTGEGGSGAGAPRMKGRSGRADRVRRGAGAAGASVPPAARACRRLRPPTRSRRNRPPNRNGR